MSVVRVHETGTHQPGRCNPKAFLLVLEQFIDVDQRGERKKKLGLCWGFDRRDRLYFLCTSTCKKKKDISIDFTWERRKGFESIQWSNTLKMTRMLSFGFLLTSSLVLAEQREYSFIRYHGRIHPFLSPSLTTSLLGFSKCDRDMYTHIHFVGQCRIPVNLGSQFGLVHYNIRV